MYLRNNEGLYTARKVKSPIKVSYYITKAKT